MLLSAHGMNHNMIIIRLNIFIITTSTALIAATLQYLILEFNIYTAPTHFNAVMLMTPFLFGVSSNDIKLMY